MKHQGYFEKQKLAPQACYDYRSIQSIFKNLNFKSLLQARINGGEHNA